MRRALPRSFAPIAVAAAFEQAQAVAPLTLPAHSSIFTGEFPPAHGVRDNGGFYLADDHVVLSEILRDEGFRTGGFVGAFVLDAKWGISQGFDHYFDDFELSDTIPPGAERDRTTRGRGHRRRAGLARPSP